MKEKKSIEEIKKLLGLDKIHPDLHWREIRAYDCPKQLLSCYVPFSPLQRQHNLETWYSPIKDSTGLRRYHYERTMGIFQRTSTKRRIHN